MKQIAVFLENRPGALNEMTRVLAENEINMKAASLSEAEGFGIFRFIADDEYNACTVLKDNGFVNRLVPVVVSQIPDTPGGLIEVLSILADADINLEYMYAYSGNSDNQAYMVFKVADENKAEAALKSAGIPVL